MANVRSAAGLLMVWLSAVTGAGRSAGAQAGGDAQLQLRRLVQALQENAALLGRQARPIHLLRVGAAQLAVADARLCGAAARPLRRQPPRRASAQQIDDRRGDGRISREL